MALTARQQGYLTPEGQAAHDTIGGLREGRTINELGERLAAVVNAVVEHITVSDSGKVTGPKGTVTLVLEVAPNENDAMGNTVRVSEKLTSKRPEDRSHVLYVGKGGTVHTTQQQRDALYSVRIREDGSRVLFASFGDGTEPDTEPASAAEAAAGEPAEAPEPEHQPEPDTEPDGGPTGLPYRDD